MEVSFGMSIRIFPHTNTWAQHFICSNFTVREQTTDVDEDEVVNPWSLCLVVYSLENGYNFPYPRLLRVNAGT